MAKFAAITVLIIRFSYYAVGKMFIKDRQKNVFQTNGKFLYIIGLMILAVIGFSSLMYLDLLNIDVMKWYWLGLLVIVMSFHTLMEWIFIKDSKEYVVSFISLLVGVAAVILLMFL